MLVVFQNWQKRMGIIMEAFFTLFGLDVRGRTGHGTRLMIPRSINGRRSGSHFMTLHGFGVWEEFCIYAQEKSLI